MTGPYANTARDDALRAQDEARANVYAIIGRFFYDAPDESLVAAIARGGGEDDAESGALARAWRELRETCGAADPPALRREFDNLFVGVGKCEITPFSSHYVKEAAPDRHLVRLRQALESWRLEKRGAQTESEDHVSGLCDVMRLLVVDSRSLDEQNLFFSEFVYPGLVPFCEAIGKSPNASFYRCVAQFTLAFLALERTAFDMEDG